MNDVFVKNILTLYGDSGRKWLDSIPQIIKTYEQMWNLQVLPPYILTYNYVAPAKKIDGTKVVIKIGYPGDREFQSEIDALEVFNGEGITKLLEADRKNTVILQKMVKPGIPLSSINDDEKATRILSSIMKKIRKPLPVTHQFTTISEWTKELSEYPHKYKTADNPPIPFKYIDMAQKLFEELIASSETPVLTHADLHHDNVLSSDRDEWLAIDPKGIVAEPMYETAAMTRNPYNKLKDMENIEEILRTRILILSEELEFDPKRIHKWCMAQTILSGVWSSDNTDHANFAMKIVKALENIHFI